MIFMYPAVFTAKDNGNYVATFPDLEGIYVEKESLDAAIDEAQDAMFGWISVEFEEDDPKLPPVSEPEDIELTDNQFIRNIMVHYRFHTGWDE